MNIIGAKYGDKINESKIKYYTWRGPKQSDGTQEEIRLMDASEEQLNRFYKHCQSMLYSTDKTNPGRKVLLDIIKDQRNRCNTELFIRYMEGSYLPDSTRQRIVRFNYLQIIREFMRNNPDYFPKDKLKEISISSITPGIPSDFENLSIDMVQSGCLSSLGLFNKKHITLSFIIKLGLWFDQAEKREFTEEAKKTGKTRLDIVRERLSLKSTTDIKLKSTGLLNYKEFRAMITLKSKRYDQLTDDQLKVLRDKVLFALEDEVEFHVSQWNERIKQIQEVAAAKGFVINE